MANALMKLFMPGSQSNAPAGSGLYQQAAEKLGSAKDYNDYVLEQTESGGTPLSRAEWLRSKNNG